MNRNLSIRKVLIFVLIAVMAFSTNVYAQSFNDIKGNWAENHINKLTEAGFINGYLDGSFKPTNSITRAELIKVVNKSLNLESYSSTKEFIDINKGAWYYDEIQVAVNNGYINGYENNTIQPNEMITREEAAKAIATAYGMNETKGNTAFKDDGEISIWAKGYVKSLTNTNIINGYQDGTFGAKKNISRAEVSKMIVEIANIEIEENDEVYVKSIKNTEMQIEREDNYSLPEKVEITLSNNSKVNVNVIWEGNLDATTLGKYELKGTINTSGIKNIEPTNLKAILTVEVTQNSEDIKEENNADFNFTMEPNQLKIGNITFNVTYGDGTTPGYQEINDRRIPRLLISWGKIQNKLNGDGVSLRIGAHSTSSLRAAYDIDSIYYSDTKGIIKEYTRYDRVIYNPYVDTNGKMLPKSSRYARGIAGDKILIATCMDHTGIDRMNVYFHMVD